MTKTAYYQLITQRLEKYFNIAPDGMYSGKKYDIAATFSSRETQTVLFKDNIMDYLDSSEVFLLTGDCRSVEDALAELKDTALSAAKPSRHHKSTAVTRVFVYGTSPEKDIIRKIRNYRFNRLFRFGFWGWTEVRTVCVDLSAGKVYTNSAGHSGRKFFTPQLIQ